MRNISGMVGMELLKTVDDPFLNHVKLLRHSEPTQIVKYPYGDVQTSPHQKKKSM